MTDGLVIASVKKSAQDFHWHTGVEVNFVLQGSMTVSIGTRSIRIGQGGIAVVNYGDSHKISECSTDLIYVQLFMRTEEFDRFIPGVSDIIFKCDPEVSDQMAVDLKKEIKDHIAGITAMLYFEDAVQNRETHIIYACLEILNDLKMGFRYGRTQLADPAEEYVWDRIWQISEYMYDNYSSRLTLEDVAEHVSLNKEYVSRFLKKYTGRSFEKLRSFIRSEISIRMLLSTEMSITAIAYECGFSAPRYYKAAFQEYFGCSPQEWRDANRNVNLKIREVHSPEQYIEEGIDHDYVKALLEPYRTVHAEADGEPMHYVIDVNEEIPLQEKPFYKTVKLPEKLLYPGGQMKPEGYAAAFTSEAGMRYRLIGKNAVLYKSNGALRVAAGNDAKSRCSIVITFDGLEPDCFYMLKQTTTKVLPHRFEHMLREGCVLQNAGELLSPNEVTEIFEGRYADIKELDMHPGQACMIEIRKLQIL